MFKHDSHDAFFRTPAGPAAVGSEITVRFLSDESEAVILRTWDGEEKTHAMTLGEDNVWSVTFTAPKETGWLWYWFLLYQKDGSQIRYGNAYDQLGGEGAVYEEGEVSSYQITLYKPSFKTPAFMQGANIYQIFPDRFCKAATKAKDTRSDRVMHASWDEELSTVSDPRSGDYMALDFFGGNLNGIAKKLSYLEKLGVTVLYLNPIFQARSNHRYDTGDYTVIDPLLGTQEDFENLCQKAAERGIRVILDGVFSHTGEDSRYFNSCGTYDTVGAYQSEKSPWYKWYTFKTWPDDYRCWWDIPSLPEVRKDNKDYQNFMFKSGEGVVPRWIEAGAAGWRLDVADELPMDFLHKLRQSAKRADKEAVVLGEVWEDASNKVAYGEMRNYCTGDTLDTVMNYPMREAILDFATGKTTAMELKRLIDHQAEVYPAPFRYALMNLVGSHDRARALNVLAGKEGKELTKTEQRAVVLTEEEYAAAVKKYEMCVELLCALPGCPTIYYGDEAGMTGCPDPFCRRPYPWGQEDKDLQKFVQKKLRHHRDSAVLKKGLCRVETLDEDTLVITRTLGAVDALGKRSAERGEEVITISRKA